MRAKDIKNEILLKPMPKCIAFILDGNGRWAKKRGMPRIFGHAKGIKTLVEVVSACQDLGVKSVLVYAFSTENWNRPTDEVDYLMKALIENLAKYKERIITNKCRVKVLGEKDNLTPEILNAIEEIETSTKMFEDFTLGICFNYGGRQEIVQATKKIAKEVKEGLLNIEDIDCNVFEKHLYTEGFPPIDLMVRTSGEVRLSNFLPYQLAYSEYVFVDTYWPDFHPKRLFEVIKEYQSRNRRFGGLKKKDYEKN